MDYSLPGSFIHGFSRQERILEWIAISFSGDLPKPGIKPRFPAVQADSLPSEPSITNLSCENSTAKIHCLSLQAAGPKLSVPL